MLEDRSTWNLSPSRVAENIGAPSNYYAPILVFLNCNSICNRAFDSWGDHSASSFDRSFNYLRETSLLASSSDKKFVFSFIDYSSDVNFVKIVSRVVSKWFRVRRRATVATKDLQRMVSSSKIKAL